MASIELVVFDIAGTTLYDGDSVRKAFEASLAAKSFSAPAERINAVMGLPKKIAVRQLLNEIGEPADDAMIGALHDDFVCRMKEFYASDPSIREIPGVSKMFAELRRRGFKLALNTGFSRDIVDAILPRVGWTVPATVDAIATSDDVPRGRPHPDLIRFLMAKFGISDPQRVAKIGDTISDLEEGDTAGCGLNIAVLTGAATRSELERYPHTHMLETATDVLSLKEFAAK